MKYCKVYVVFGVWALAAIAGLARGETAGASRAAFEARGGNKIELEAVEVGDTKPAHQFGRYFLAGQPAPGDLPRWKELGVGTLINLRMPKETDWDERAAVEALGMEYISIPFGGPDTLSDRTLQTALRALRTGRLRDEANNEKGDDEKAGAVLLHCASSNRVGAIWYAHRVLDDGLDRDAAIEGAQQVGLRTMGYLDPVHDFIERAQQM